MEHPEHRLGGQNEPVELFTLDEFLGGMDPAVVAKLKRIAAHHCVPLEDLVRDIIAERCLAEPPPPQPN